MKYLFLNYSDNKIPRVFLSVNRTSTVSTVLTSHVSTDTVRAFFDFVRNVTYSTTVSCICMLRRVKSIDYRIPVPYSLV